MKNGQVIAGMIFALGLIATSFPANLPAEENAESKAKTHGDTQAGHTQENGKKADQANTEVKEPATSSGETSATPAPGGHGMHEGSDSEEMEEGSH